MYQGLGGKVLVSEPGGDASRVRAKGPLWALHALLLLFLLVLSACASSATAEPAPPTIHYGEDVCELCGMIISEERYAAGYITADGQQHIFDDIGDMFQAQPANNQEIVAFFAHNYENNQWIRAEKATFVQSKGLRTPMASGLAAFESAEKARTFAAEVQGELMTFSEVSAYYKANPMPEMKHKQGMEHNQ
jgi:nitrous oxide reductase accessory protein NosL